MSNRNKKTRRRGSGDKLPPIEPGQYEDKTGTRNDESKEAFSQDKTRSLPWGKVAGILAALASIVAILTFLLDVPEKISEANWFPRARPGEVLVIVADFSGDKGEIAANRIYAALIDRVIDSNLSDGVRVERFRKHPPRSSNEASLLGQRYLATLIIWGTADSIGIAPDYTIVNNNYAISIQPELETVEGNRPEFNAYILEGAPREFEYLMLMTLGQLAISTEEYELAIEYFDSALALELEPSHVKQLNISGVYVSRGYAFASLGDHEAAIENYERSSTLDPGSGLPYIYLGDLYYNELRDYESAALYYDQALALNFDLSVSDWAMGRRCSAFYQTTDYESIVRTCSETIDVHKELVGHSFPFVHVARCTGYANLGDYDSAIADCSEAIELDPQDAWTGRAYLWRCYAYANSDEFDLAITDCSRAIELDPENSSAYLWRCGSYRRLKDYDAAIGDCSRSIELEPENSVAYEFRCMLYAQQQQYDLAILDCSQSIELQPENAEAFFWRCGSYLALSNLEMSIADCSRAIELEPQNPALYCERGMVYERMNDDTYALSDFNKCLELADGGPFADTALEHIQALQDQEP